MLYDKKWDAKVETTPLQGLIAWLETQDPSKTYCFYNGYSCAVAHYMRASGNFELLSSYTIKNRFGYLAHTCLRNCTNFGQLLRELKALS